MNSKQAAMDKAKDKMKTDKKVCPSTSVPPPLPVHSASVIESPRPPMHAHKTDRVNTQVHALYILANATYLPRFYCL